MANRSLISVLTEANKVSDCETTSALHRAQLRFSREDKGKAVVTSVPAAKSFVREAKSEAQFGASSEATLLKEKVLHRTKAPSAKIASPHGETILTSLPAKRKGSKAKSKFKFKTSQPSGLISSLSKPPCWIIWVQSTQTYENFWATSGSLALKSKLTSRHLGADERGVNMLHSAKCYLEPIPTTSPPNQLSVFDRLSAQTSEEPRTRSKRKAKKSHLAVASVNMMGRGRDPTRSRRGRRGIHAPSVSFLDPNYSTGLSQVLIEPEGAFEVPTLG